MTRTMTREPRNASAFLILVKTITRWVVLYFGSVRFASQG